MIVRIFEHIQCRWALNDRLALVRLCRNVLIEGVTLVDSPFWVVHPTFCSNVIVRGVTVISPHINNDGVETHGR